MLKRLAPKRLFLLVAFATSAIVLAFACRTPTQVTLSLTTDVNCANGATPDAGVLLATDLYSGDGKGNFASTSNTQTTECEPPSNGVHRIGSIVLVPSGSKDEAFGIEVIASLTGSNGAACCKAYFDGDAGACGGADPSTSCIKETRDLSFIPHDDSRTLEVFLPDVCKGKKCVPGQTCAVDGTCVPDNGCQGSGDCPPPAGDGGGVFTTIWANGFLQTGDAGLQYADGVVVDEEGGVSFVGSFTGTLPFPFDGGTNTTTTTPLGFAAFTTEGDVSTSATCDGGVPAGIALQQGHLVIASPPPDAPPGHCFAGTFDPTVPVCTLSSFTGYGYCSIGGLWVDTAGIAHAGGLSDGGEASQGVVGGAQPINGAFAVLFSSSTLSVTQLDTFAPLDTSTWTQARFAGTNSFQAGVGLAGTVVHVLSSPPDGGAATAASMGGAGFSPQQVAVAVDPQGNVAAAFVYTGNAPALSPAPADGGVEDPLPMLPASCPTSCLGVVVLDPALENVQPQSFGEPLPPESVAQTALVFDPSGDLYVAVGLVSSNLRGSNVGLSLFHEHGGSVSPAVVLTTQTSSAVNHVAVAWSPDNTLVLAGGFRGGIALGDGGLSTPDPSDIFVAKVIPP